MHHGSEILKTRKLNESGCTLWLLLEMFKYEFTVRKTARTKDREKSCPVCNIDLQHISISANLLIKVVGGAGNYPSLG